MVNYNALHNAKNEFQTKAKRVLCVCSAGLLRSPTAANVLHKEFGYNTRAAGLEESYALIPVNKLLLHWADEIVCMEQYQADAIALLVDKPVYCLSVPDCYEWNDPALRKAIFASYDKVVLGNDNGI